MFVFSNLTKGVLKLHTTYFTVSIHHISFIGSQKQTSVIWHHPGKTRLPFNLHVDNYL